MPLGLASLCDSAATPAGAPPTRDGSAQSQRQTYGTATSAAPLTVVVDDDAAQRFLSGTLFEEADFEVAECSTADEAWELIQRRGDDVRLLFTDIYLPGRMDGIELARRVRDALPNLPVIVTSGAAGERLHELPPSAEFLAKPWRPLDLLIRAERVRA